MALHVLTAIFTNAMRIYERPVTVVSRL